MKGSRASRRGALKPSKAEVEDAKPRTQSMCAKLTGAQMEAVTRLGKNDRKLKLEKWEGTNGCGRVERDNDALQKQQVEEVGARAGSRAAHGVATLFPGHFFA